MPSTESPLPDLPDLVLPDALVETEPILIGSSVPEPEANPTSPPVPGPVSPLPRTIVSQPSNSEAEPDPNLTIPPASPPVPELVLPLPGTIVSQPNSSEAENESFPDLETVPPPTPPVASQPEVSAIPLGSSPPPPVASPSSAKTQLQVQSVYLLHLQTNTKIELPQHLLVLHVGKPNDQIPPDIDVSGFPNSDIVSRIHADIRVEGDAYYIEDVGSSNGTYINHTPLLPGNRHRLRMGDRISLGKGDQMTFLFQNS